jgi:hypothetical protein
LSRRKREAYRSSPCEDQFDRAREKLQRARDIPFARAGCVCLAARNSCRVTVLDDHLQIDTLELASGPSISGTSAIGFQIHRAELPPSQRIVNACPDLSLGLPFNVPVAFSRSMGVTLGA